MYSKALLAILLVQACEFCVVTSTSVLSNFTDLHSLLAFKSAITFDRNDVLANNWTSDTNFCDWYGVSCSKRRQRVTSLNLTSMGLVGTISPQVGNLSFLTVLNLRSNGFHGQVIEELGQLSRLKVLRLSRNNFTGEIPISLPRCQKLELIYLSQNGLTGTILKNLSTLPSIRVLAVGNNHLTGTIPRSFGNISSLQVLGLEINKFHGTILNELVFLPRVTGLYLGDNYFRGTIPSSLFNISSLENLGLALNFFTGDLPKDAGLQLPNVIQLVLGANQFTGSVPSHFYNASKLILLAIEQNNFSGTLPGALPVSLQVLTASHCHLQDEIPKEIGTWNNMTYLTLEGNKFRGTIPPTIKGMENIQQLSFSGNQLEGPIPDEICTLKNLGVILLRSNRFSGSIPWCIGNLSGLQQLFLDSNRLSSTIPPSLWSLSQLLFLNLSSNTLQGNVSLNFTMKSLTILDLSRNQLSGNIPGFSGSSQSLTFLDFSWNSFSGCIPEPFRNLISLIDLNISNNNLSGQIPKSFEALMNLRYLNLSYNKLSGEIPTGGPFVNFTAQSYIENPELCGQSIFKSCSSQGSRKSSSKLLPLSYIVPIIVVVLIIGVFFYVCRKRSINDLVPETPPQVQGIISYHELSRATIGFSEANFLGSGGFGRVYKGILSDGEIVAIKILNLAIDGAFKSFDAECKVLRTVRHRNLVKVISTCTNHELRALVLEFIPNGSLEKWLYSHNYCLSFLQRVNVMLDVAVAMDYLHCGQSEPVIHCDLKPSNVLLDNDMVAHVGDFGISKILSANKIDTQTSTLGTFGYIAPEYGTAGRVSANGDTYSYGIMLLETFTRKNPTDDMFSEESSLTQWVSSSVPHGIAQVVDGNLMNSEAQEISEMSLQCNLLAVLDIGLGCSRNSPEERFEMKDVVTKLYRIRQQIISL